MATTKQVVKKVTKQPKKQATKTPEEVKTLEEVKAPKKEEFPSEWQRPEADATTTPGEIESPIEWMASWPAPIAENTPKGVEAPVKNPTEDQLNKEINKVGKMMEKKEEVKVFQVHQAKWFIRTKAYRTPIPMYKLPPDIRQYLLNKGFGTNVWEKDKAWLEKHKADMEMIERLKKFISENYL